MSTPLVLDTNVLSELMKPAPNERVMRWFDANASAEFATTAINEAELLAGIALLPEGRKKRRLGDALKAALRDELGGRVFEFDSNAARELAAIVRVRARKGTPIDFQDACIAAICKARGSAIVTRDTNGFEGTGIVVVDPWTA